MSSKLQLAAITVVMASAAVTSPGAQAGDSVSPSAKAVTASPSAVPVVSDPPPTLPVASLAEIVVTAQRRSQDLQRAAVPLAVVSGDALAQHGVTTPAGLTGLVPALAAQNAGGAATTFFVRGVGNFAVNGYTDPAIAFNYDGVYIAQQTSTQGLLYDLQRVEVLKGPQGTLYGMNATAGAINVLPEYPNLGRNSGFVTASVGNYSSIDAQGAINVALGQNTALRFSAMRSKHNGYLSDGSSDEDLSAARIQLLWKLTETLSARIAADYSIDRGTGGGSSYAFGYSYNRATSSYAFTPTGMDAGVGLFDPVAQAYRVTRFSGLSGRSFAPLDRKPFLDNDNGGVNAQINWTSPIGTLTILPAYRTARLDEIFTIPAFEAYLQEHDKQYSLEAYLSANHIVGSLFDYILGAYYFNGRVDAHYVFNQQSLAPFTDILSKTSANAVYARLTAHVTRRLRLVGGARYTADDRHFDGSADTIQVICTVRVAGVPYCPSAPLMPTVAYPTQVGFPVPGPAGGVVPIGTTGAIANSVLTTVNTPLDMHRVNYRAAAEYDAGRNSMLYVSYENAFRAGGFSLAEGHETYQPEYIDAYTIGSKSRMLDNRLQLNVEAFLWKYRNQQVTHSGIDSRGLQTQFTSNVGTSTNKGVEIEADALATPNLLLGSDIQYLRARYDSFVYQVPVSGTPPLTGCSYSQSAATPTMYNIDCSGKPAYYSPTWTVDLKGQQTFHAGDARVVLEIDTQFKSSRVVGFEYLPLEIVHSNWRSNAQLSLTPGGADYTVTAYVDNIENERTPVAFNGLALAGVMAENPSAPRTFGVRVSASF